MFIGLSSPMAPCLIEDLALIQFRDCAEEGGSIGFLICSYRVHCETIGNIQRPRIGTLPMIEIGSRNNAPPSQHPFHDIYLFHIDPAKPDTPFCFEQSMSGGHMEHGGARWLALDELDAWPGEWREHLQKADCAWVAGLIDAYPKADQATLVSLILQRHCGSAKPVGFLKAIGNWLKRNIHVGGRYGV
jgi:hypothetical protein